MSAVHLTAAAWGCNFMQACPTTSTRSPKLTDEHRSSSNSCTSRGLALARKLLLLLVSPVLLRLLLQTVGNADIQILQAWQGNSMIEFGSLKTHSVPLAHSAATAPGLLRSVMLCSLPFASCQASDVS